MNKIWSIGSPESRRQMEAADVWEVITRHSLGNFFSRDWQVVSYEVRPDFGCSFARDAVGVGGGHSLIDVTRHFKPIRERLGYL